MLLLYVVCLDHTAHFVATAGPFDQCMDKHFENAVNCYRRMGFYNRHQIGFILWYRQKQLESIRIKTFTWWLYNQRSTGFSGVWGRSGVERRDRRERMAWLACFCSYKYLCDRFVKIYRSNTSIYKMTKYNKHDSNLYY